METWLLVENKIIKRSWDESGLSKVLTRKTLRDLATVIIKKKKVGKHTLFYGFPLEYWSVVDVIRIPLDLRQMLSMLNVIPRLMIEGAYGVSLWRGESTSRYEEEKVPFTLPFMGTVYMSPFWRNMVNAVTRVFREGFRAQRALQPPEEEVTHLGAPDVSVPTDRLMNLLAITLGLKTQQINPYINYSRIKSEFYRKIKPSLTYKIKKEMLKLKQAEKKGDKEKIEYHKWQIENFKWQLKQYEDALKIWATYMRNLEE